MKKIKFGFGLVLMTLYVTAQTPTVSLSLDKTSMSEAGGVATLTATLSAPASQAVKIILKPTGTASYQADYDASFAGKGKPQQWRVEMELVQQTINFTLLAFM
jgi:hypothetical protein